MDNFITPRKVIHLCNQHNYHVLAVSCTPKQIDLQAFLSLPDVKSTAAQYKRCYLMRPQSIFTKEI